MTYQQYGTIQAADIDNNLAGPVNGISSLNSIWGTGFGSRGYGQLPLIPYPNIGDPVRSVDWSNMNTIANKIAMHTSTSISPDYFPTGSTVFYNQGQTRTMIDALDANRTSSRFQAPQPNIKSMANDYGWFNKVEYTITATFPDGDSARYYFNCGGQLAFRTWQPGINSIPARAAIAQLGIDIGTIYWSIIPGGAGQSTIQKVKYSATTKIGGSGSPAILAGSQDYYAASTYSLTNTPTTIFKQFVRNSVTGYDGSFMSLGVYSKGDKGLNGANGNIIVFKFIVDIAPLSLAMPSGGIVYVYTVGPLADSDITYLDIQSWATPTIDITISAT